MAKKQKNAPINISIDQKDLDERKQAFDFLEQNKDEILKAMNDSMKGPMRDIRGFKNALDKLYKGS